MISQKKIPLRWAGLGRLPIPPLFKLTAESGSLYESVALKGLSSQTSINHNVYNVAGNLLEVHARPRALSVRLRV